MDNELIKSREASEKIIASEPKPFKGYSLEELRYQRALVALQKEFSKSKVLNTTRKIRKQGISGMSGRTGKSVGIVGKMLTGMNYIDYAMLGLSAFNTGRKIFSFFRRKK